MPRGFLVRRYPGEEVYPLDLSFKPKEEGEEKRPPSGDIDPGYYPISVTEEAKAELAKIENRIGDYVCRLCQELYEDPFGLAGHRCSGIAVVDYACPECGKTFNCPANLASHRRWHRPRETPSTFPCPSCPEAFPKRAYLKKHLVTHDSTFL